jgi:GNAT superfamily N-acetyltransferase
LESDDAGAVLCRAFENDPAMSWAVPELEKRRAMQAWFTAIVHWGLDRGEVESLDGKAVAVWGHGPAKFFEQVKAGLLKPTLSLGATSLIRLLKLSSATARNHALLCPEPHRYLWFVGVDPKHQRQGLGAKLLRRTLAKADKEKVPCYLETATEANVPFYAALGFGVVFEGELVTTAPRFWLMKRPTRAK